MQMKFDLTLNRFVISSYLMLLKLKIHLPQYIVTGGKYKNSNFVGSSLALFIPRSKLYI